MMKLMSCFCRHPKATKLVASRNAVLQELMPNFFLELVWLSKHGGISVFMEWKDCCAVQKGWVRAIVPWSWVNTPAARFLYTL